MQYCDGPLQVLGLFYVTLRALCRPIAKPNFPASYLHFLWRFRLRRFETPLVLICEQPFTQILPPCQTCALRRAKNTRTFLSMTTITRYSPRLVSSRKTMPGFWVSECAEPGQSSPTTRHFDIVCCVALSMMEYPAIRSLEWN